jgi:methylated-DNA-[protein]-cysteine S-methyltransferase
LGALDAIPAAVSGSPFQSAAWAAVRAVPAGEVVTYQQLADRLGHPNGARAIGRAMATNLTPILIPCHRVVAGDGSLAGYRGGATRKRWLLAHEAGQSSLF